MMAQGGCACGKCRYQLNAEPIVVHCCHCSWCQRESGASFALNAVIEGAQLQILGEQPDRIETPSASGRGQTVLRCPHCKVALWSHYSTAGDLAAFIRVGTLDDPSICPPDVHIFTESAQSWLVLPETAERFPQFYSGKDVVRIYGEEGAARWRGVMDQAKAAALRSS